MSARIVKWGTKKVRRLLGKTPPTERYAWLATYLRPAGRPGFFIEAGAHDGRTASNTYELERRDKWRGLLVEPIPSLNALCRKQRPRAIVERYALVPPERSGAAIPMKYASSMSIVEGAMKSREGDEQHLANALPHMQADETIHSLEVPGITLTELLDRHHVGEIDFLSLDVEGFEMDALKGLDLERYKPRFALIEARFRDEILAFMQPLYDIVAETGDYDILFQLRAAPPGATPR